jgi:hypothetical protein
LVGTDSWNSGIVLEVINGISGIRWNRFRGRNWFHNVQHRGIGCILKYKRFIWFALPKDIVSMVSGQLEEEIGFPRSIGEHHVD